MNSKSLSRQDEDSMRKVNYKTKKARTYKEWSPKFKHQSGQLLKIITKLSKIKKKWNTFHPHMAHPTPNTPDLVLSWKLSSIRSG
jgi:hypothetical protein